MVERSGAHRSQGAAHWAYTIAMVGFLGWAAVFVADETHERLIAGGMIFSLVALALSRRTTGRPVASSSNGSTLALAVVVVGALFAFLLMGRWVAAGVAALAAVLLLGVVVRAPARGQQTDPAP